MTDTPGMDFTQDIMNDAYLKYQANPGWGFDEFVENLPRREAAAVTIGKLNQQIFNGGFLQWLDNGYSVGLAGDTLERELAHMESAGNELAGKILAWVKEARQALVDYYDDCFQWNGGGNLDVGYLDKPYYDAVDEGAWFNQVAEFLQTLPEAN